MGKEDQITKMYHEYTQEELRAYCRSNIESLETWARRLIKEQLVYGYGADFLNKKNDNGDYLIKKDIRNHMVKMMKSDPNRFKHPIDTLFMDHIIYFLCNPKWYKTLFKKAMDYAYPDGMSEVRTLLGRLIPIRNNLSHSNPISMHQVEQAICYSQDFIEGLKQYYKEKGEEQMWNVPRIIKVKDSLGNVYENIEENSVLGAHFNIKKEFYCGDTYTIEVEVDSSFSKDEYRIKWAINGQVASAFDNSNKLSIQFNSNHVSQNSFITCTIVSDKEWHRFLHHDSIIYIDFTVLPPLNGKL